jgi:hypothetical protein
MSAALLLVVFVKTHKSFLDPLFFNLVMAVLANAVPIFLFLTDTITESVFVYVLVAETLFWVGFLMFYKKENVFKNAEIEEDENNDFRLFLAYLSLLVVLKLLIYTFVEIPLFSEKSRLEVFANSGGLGLLERLSSFPSFFCSFYAFQLYDRRGKYRWLAIIALSLVALFSILSASKGAVLIIVAGYFYYNHFYMEKNPSLKIIIKYTPILLLVPLLILYVQQDDESPIMALMALMVRLVSSGDVYFMSLPDNAFDYITINNKIMYFFSGLLAPLRFIDITDVDSAIGYQLSWNIYPMSDGASGPNTRTPILSWIFFSWYGVFFSFIIGAIVSFLYNKISMLFSRGIVNYAIVAYLQYTLIAFITDPVLGVGLMFDVFINLALFIVIYLAINKTITRTVYD